MWQNPIEADNASSSMTDFSARRRMMVDTQVRPSDVTKFPIIEAMLTIPRELFVPDSQRESAYAGGNVDLGDGRVLLEPRTLAKMLDVLDVQPNELVLDVGSALGYSAAIVASLSEAVVALEEREDLASESQDLLAEVGADNVVLHEGALSEGAGEHGPYDVILIEGGIETVPETLLDQLKDGGRIACVMMDRALGTVRVGHKSGGMMTWRLAFNAGAPVLPGFEKAKAFAL